MSKVSMYNIYLYIYLFLGLNYSTYVKNEDPKQEDYFMGCDVADFVEKFHGKT